MAEILSKQYASVFTEPDPDETISNIKEFFNHEGGLNDIYFTVNDVASAMKTIPLCSSPGPDQFPAFLLNRFSVELAPALYRIWRDSLDSGEMPEGTNLAYISPIFKGGDRTLPKNYRPVALTSHLTKVFEKVVKAALVEYLTTNNLFNPGQHGFRRGHSTLTQLIQYYEDILTKVESSDSVDSIYLDFAKAFDKCDHSVIMTKLKHFGVSGKVGIWIGNFIRMRKQAVSVDGEISETMQVVSRVPQGSVLGPILFLILISDIDNGIHESSVSSFADDTRAWRGIKTEEDSARLQSDLATVYDWAERNRMVFNASKFECVKFGKSSTSQVTYLSSSGLPIQCVDHVRDLGITLSGDCTFKAHAEKTISACNQMAGWIFRTFSSRDKDTLLPLYKQLVMSRAEYCCILWSPTDSATISRLESIQRAFTRRLDNFNGVNRPNYWERLSALKMYSLERRRERYAIIFVWKALQGPVPDPGFLPRTNPRTGTHLELPKIVTSAPAWLKKARRNSFSTF